MSVPRFVPGFVSGYRFSDTVDCSLRAPSGLPATPDAAIDVQLLVSRKRCPDTNQLDASEESPIPRPAQIPSLPRNVSARRNHGPEGDTAKLIAPTCKIASVQ